MSADCPDGAPGAPVTATAAPGRPAAPGAAVTGTVRLTAAWLPGSSAAGGARQSAVPVSPALRSTVEERCSCCEGLCSARQPVRFPAAHSLPAPPANGRVRAAPRTFAARPGQRVRIRFINAGADTAFRVALGGHVMTVTHTDGYPVSPVRASALLLGMGERYDVLVTLGDGVFPLTALAEGKDSTALALVRTGAGTAPPADVRPAELGGVLAGYAALPPADREAWSACPFVRRVAVP